MTDESDLELEYELAMTPNERLERISKLIPSRWNELLAGETRLDRRVKTMGLCSSVREALQLAQLQLTKDEEELQARRGELMRPDVCQEAVQLLGQDRAVKTQGAFRDTLRPILEKLSDKQAKSVAREDVAELRSLTRILESSYSDWHADAIKQALIEKNPSILKSEICLEQLAAHARGLGWSDTGLIDLCEKVCREHSSAEERLLLLSSRVSTPPRKMTCAITVHSGGLDLNLLQHERYGISVRSGNGEVQVLVTLEAHDPWAAASDAISRVSSLLGSANIFLSEPGSIAFPDRAVVLEEGTSREIRAGDSLHRDPHNPRQGQLRDILEVAARSTALRSSEDTLFQAIRNHHRALESDDIESGFALLWAGLERLCMHPTRPGQALNNTADLVASALALGKLRREVSSLSEAMTTFLEGIPSSVEYLLEEVDPEVIRENRRVVSHDRLLGALIGTPEHAETFLAPFYEDVRLAQWFFRLRSNVHPGTNAQKLGKKVVDLIRDSRQKSYWQVLRLYRARNGIAHGFGRPLWLGDLARHANYFLINALSICLTYAPGGRSPHATLAERRGYLNTYLKLLAAEHPETLSNSGLLRPSRLFSHR